MAIHKGCTLATAWGLQRWSYPDGRSYMEQPAIGIAMLEAIDWAINADREAHADA